MPASRTVFLAVSADPERLLRLGLWTLTAASHGEAVDILLCAGPLAALAEGRAGETVPATALGLLPLRKALDEARGLAKVRVVTCDTELMLAGVAPADAAELVDEMVSLPSFWRALGDARVVTL